MGQLGGRLALWTFFLAAGLFEKAATFLALLEKKRSRFFLPGRLATLAEGQGAMGCCHLAFLNAKFHKTGICQTCLALEISVWHFPEKVGIFWRVSKALGI